jgi:hypothetical protein
MLPVDVTHSLRAALDPAAAATSRSPEAIDLVELQAELEVVAAEVLRAREAELPLPEALRHPAYPRLRAFHQDLRDALFVELPAPMQQLAHAAGLSTPASSAAPASPDPAAASPAAEPARAAGGSGGDPGLAAASMARLGDTLVGLAQGQRELESGDLPLQRALAELLVFESVRLRLLLVALSTPEFETLGGEEADVDELAWDHVEALLREPALREPGVRPLQVMFAAAAVALAADATRRSDELRRASESLRERMRMRAKVHEALRSLRLPDAVLLGNALSNLLGEDRAELPELQSQRRLALDGMSRQAMDQRVSRGRRALGTGDRERWPTRRQPALFDLWLDRWRRARER